MDAIQSGQRLTIRPTYIVSTPIWETGNFRRTAKQLHNQINLKDNSHKGKLSDKSITKLRNSINWLTSSAQWKPIWWQQESRFIYFKVNFITLTVPKQPTGDGEINGQLFSKMLNTWLVYSRKYHYLKNYVWKYERGEEGKLHIHLTTDTFIPWQKVRDSWNRIMQSHGLIDDYFKEYGHYDPNSTDIHACKKVDDLAAYLCKYMSKSTGLEEKFKNRIWGCSYSLNEKCEHIVDMDMYNSELPPLYHKDIRWKNIESKADMFGKSRKIGEVFFMTAKNWITMGNCAISKAYNEHRFRIRTATPKLPEQYAIIWEGRNPNYEVKPIITGKIIIPLEPILKIERGKILTLFDN